MSIENMTMPTGPGVETKEQEEAQADRRAYVIEQLKGLGIAFNPRQKTYTLEKMLADAQPKVTEVIEVTTEVTTEAPPVVIQTPLATAPEVVTIKADPVVEAPPVAEAKVIKVSEVTSDQAKAMLLEYAKVNGREKVMTLLAQFGATNVTGVEAAGKLEEFVKAMGN